MNEDLQIPIYRGKKIDSDEDAEGYYFPQFKTHYIFDGGSIEIDPSTLAIHFPDMIDSEGTKIFASLSESGRGGDILIEEPYVNKWVTKFGNYNTKTKIN